MVSTPDPEEKPSQELLEQVYRLCERWMHRPHSVTHAWMANDAEIFAKLRTIITGKGPSQDELDRLHRRAEVKPETPTKPPERRRLPAERAGLTKKFRLQYTHKDGSADEMKFYFRTGCYPDGSLGEIFITADRVGTLASGALDAVATLASMLLQYGVPLETITEKLRHTRFPPAGFTGGDADVKSCSSPLDLLAQYLDLKYGASKEPTGTP